MRLVDACHARGLGVLIDAVFNHLGPSGNYLPKFGPYLSSASNPWGEGVNIADADADEVRRYIIDCALRWMRDFHADGLRLDAVHALVDTTAIHILEELSAETDALAAEVGPPAVADRRERPQRPAADHAARPRRLRHDRAVGRRHPPRHPRRGVRRAAGLLRRLRLAGHAGADAAERLLPRRARTRRSGIAATAGRWTPRPIPATRLLAYTCTHDQVGNRAVGDRPSQNLTTGQLAVKAALVLGSPYTAMLFMGEEWGASTPVPVLQLPSRTGAGRGPPRRAAKRSSPSTAGTPTTIPDPQDPRPSSGPS